VKRLLPGLALAVLVLAVFAQTAGFGFVNVDDDAYVYENRHVLAGLSARGVGWAFGGFRVQNWHPLTWLSHMADVSLLGPAPGPMHAVNVALHLAAALLLLAVLRAATGSTWRSAAVAALFAVHPLHVESVAWISERKDVLSTALGLAALLAWVRWVRGGSRRAYGAALGLFVLSLLAKPMLVTLPGLLLLLDGWPLGRLPLCTAREAFRALPPLLAEKLPFLALSAVASAVTVAAQSSGGADAALAHLPPGRRGGNALLSVAAYLGQAAWPADLAVFYPHRATVPGALSAARVAGAATLVLALTALALRERLRRPWLLFGWLWFLGTLLPVVGLVQVGSQAMADRYTYVPLVGIFVAVAWGAGELAARGPAWRAGVLGAGAAALLGLAAVAHAQVGVWRDAVTLQRHALQVNPANWKAWQGLCSAELDLGRLGEAAPACERAVALLPTFHDAWNTLGVVHARRGEHALALQHFRHALELRPGYFLALRNAGAALGNLGRPAEAAPLLAQAAALRPDAPDAWAMLATARAQSGDAAGAREALERLRAIDPARAARISSPTR